MPFAVRRLREFAWCIGDYTYLYFHTIDDQAVTKSIDLGAKFCGAIIVPPAHEEILWRVCSQVSSGQTPSIVALNQLVVFRILFANRDFSWSRDQALLTLLCRYNQHAAASMRDIAMQVDIPSTLITRQTTPKKLDRLAAKIARFLGE